MKFLPLVMNFVILGVAVFFAWKAWSWWSFAYLAGGGVVNIIVQSALEKMLKKT